MPISITRIVNGEDVAEDTDNPILTEIEDGFNNTLGGLEPFTVQLWGEQGSNPSAPSANQQRTFFKGDALYSINDAGSVVGISNGVSLLERTQLGASATSVSISSIPAGWNLLELLVEARSDFAGSDSLFIRFNDDATAANYYSGNTTIVSSGGGSLSHATYNGTVQGNLITNCVVDDSAGPAGYFSLVRVLIKNYGSTSYARQSLWTAGVQASSTAYRTVHGFGTWTNAAAAITKITILPVNGPNLLTGSAYALNAYK